MDTEIATETTKTKRTMSPEARARISASQKKRWAKARAATEHGKNGTNGHAKPHARPSAAPATQVSLRDLERAEKQVAETRQAFEAAQANKRKLAQAFAAQA